MRFVYLLVLLFSYRAVFAQVKTLDPLSDTTFWYKLKQTDRNKIGLKDLARSRDSFYIRFWMENQAVEIWTNDFKTFGGKLSIHTEKVGTRYSNAEISGRKQFFSTIKNLDTSLSRIIYQYFLMSSIIDIPTEKRIQGWEKGDDGTELILETATPTTYSFKTFWSPEMQRGLPQAGKVTNLFKTLDSTLKLNNQWKRFLSSLPEGWYRYGEIALRHNPIFKRSKEK